MRTKNLDQTIDLNRPSFGPHLYNGHLQINSAFSLLKIGKPTVIDCETSEDDKPEFVGIALTQNGIDIIYTTELAPVKLLLEKSPLIGQQLKGDMKWLKSWGINIKSDQLYYDTCLASYVINTTKESHGLKDLAKEYFNMVWPTYKEMVGKGKKKETLDKQEIGRVAAYCGMDCFATYRLYEHFQKIMTPQQKRYLETIELPVSRVLMDMELKGAEVDIEYLKELKDKFTFHLEQLEEAIETVYKDRFPEAKEFNVNSNKQIADLLEKEGAILPLTMKGNKKVDKATLNQWQQLPVVPLLLEYNKLEKLLSTYVEPLLEKNKNGRIYCNFNQISRTVKGTTFGISTGRLSSSEPNLQNIPTRSEEGEQIRKAFISRNNEILIDADYSQIEPRLVAHFSKDPLFIRSFRENRDIYQELVEGTGRDRADGKTFMLALLYGAQPKKLASVFKCSELEAEEIINKIMRKLPGVVSWINRTKYEARQKRGVYTLFKRWIPLPGITSTNYYDRLHWERAAVNYSIQGSAAEIMKLALCKLKDSGYVPSLTVHDEVLIEVNDNGKGIDTGHINLIKNVMESIIQLEVPIKVDVGIGKTWSEAKQ